MSIEETIENAVRKQMQTLLEPLTLKIEELNSSVSLLTPKKTFTVKEMAEKMRVSEQTIIIRIHKGKIQAQRNEKGEWHKPYLVFEKEEEESK